MPVSSITLSSAVTGMRYRLGDPTEAYWSTAFLTRSVKRAVSEYSARNLLSWNTASLSTASPHSAAVALPSRFWKVDTVFGPVKELSPGSDVNFRAHQFSPNTTGDPEDYIIHRNSTITFRPLPTVAFAFTVWYFETVDADPITGKFPMPDSDVEAALELAYALAFEKEGEAQDLRLAAKYTERFEAGVGLAARNLGGVSAERSVVLGGGFGEIGGIASPVMPPEFGTPVGRRGRQWR